jgi:uncharacterized membrane protein YccC
MLPSWRDWIFSAKTFSGAMLALWIARRMGLDRPYWAMATSCIVAQPLTGAMRSKAAYRFCGTVLGAIATLVLIPNLVDAPVLLIGALSLWVGGCIYFAVLDRTPRSYVFLLAGYSVALIGFPIVDSPDTVWDVVLARVDEITLGIVCTTVIGSIVYPILLGPALAARLDNWIRDAADWTRGVLSRVPENAAITTARRKVAGDATEIAMLASHLAYDTSNLQTATVPVVILHQRVLLLLPIVSGAADRVRILREIGGITSGQLAWQHGPGLRTARLDARQQSDGFNAHRYGSQSGHDDLQQHGPRDGDLRSDARCQPLLVEVRFRAKWTGQLHANRAGRICAVHRSSQL